MPSELFTIGHSTHTLDRFLELLAQHQIGVVADIRRFPGSRKYPHFNRESLASALPAAGVAYIWIEALGGRRGQVSGAPSKNLGLRNENFRNYADYMATSDFRAGIEQLLTYATKVRTAYMCSESVFWRCHRRLVSDFLFSREIAVHHIMPSGELRSHTLTSGARVADGEVTYPLPTSDQRQLAFE